MTNATAAAPTNPLQGLYDFARGHVLIANSLITASGTIVALLDFFGPKLSFVPRVVYSCTGLLVAAMFLSAFFPRAARLVLARSGMATFPDNGKPLWRAPAWQFLTTLLLLVTLLGSWSVAKASSGGALASQFETAREMQAAILGTRADTQAIKTGVDAANAKLDRIADAVDPDNPADKCPDLDCAVADGASRKTFEKLLAKGKKLPEGYAFSGYFGKLVKERSPARFEIADIYREQSGADFRAPFHNGVLGNPIRLELIVMREYRQALPRLPQLQAMPQTFDYGWQRLSGCVAETNGGFTIAQLALIAGDQELYQHESGKRNGPAAMACDLSKLDPTAKGKIELSEAEIAAIDSNLVTTP
ncbi:hypothetical protein [Pseudoduganella aquatica]|uniref:Uncharacterized protein n=1 Tax=Pseudoduganella aquatica TaxID=2660641 RepID=A0A7X4KQE2_9BURK|nr:hypothetical protein [Pseudoduganella aquatica]MYN10196.1 hypothetical protein [Pseudoduganella aquatica]